VETTLEDGTVGYGEGLPRTYVTGETQEGVLQSLGRLPRSFYDRNFESIAEVVRFIDAEILSDKNFAPGRANNTARCALELSFLDAFGNHFKATFKDIALLAVQNPSALQDRSEVKYCGVLSLGSLPKSILSILKMKIFGFSSIKLKLGPDFRENIAAIQWMRRLLNPRVDIHVDANEAWTLESALANIRALVPYNVSAVEQPLPHKNLQQMAELKRKSPLPLMLDESLCSRQDAEASIENKWCDFWNIRLSKCGGFIASLRLAEFARESGIHYQLGCMVGESGILSAAGRHFGILDPGYHFLEGSFDHYLLQDNVITEDISFHRGGKAPALTGFGLGVKVELKKLTLYSVQPVVLF
jgi:L-Ala-D/L-Glu epimerase